MITTLTGRWKTVPAWCAAAFLCVAAVGQSAEPTDIRTYIATSWETLSRSMSECRSLVDVKVTTSPVLYLPAGMAVPPAVAAMQQQCRVDVRHLPKTVQHLGDVREGDLAVPGLLYLPNRYVVPGGRFNEMYGWDSYFILMGLVRDGHAALAKGMVENFFFEIENYGAILNANRTYFFTRSQPPFLSSMIREVYEHPSVGAPPDKHWLEQAYRFAERDYALWTSAQHRADTTGLARYHDLGAGPVPEMSDDSSYYPDVIRWLLAHPDQHPEYLIAGSSSPTATEAAALRNSSCDVAMSKVCMSAVVEGHRLSARFYEGDRAMRESGFDSSFRFGPFSGSTEDYAPVCLNSLLYRYEKDMAYFATALGHRKDASTWEHRATQRKAAVDRYLWDEQQGIYRDFNFVTGKPSSYPFITSFYPLWAGLATPEQAAKVRAHLGSFEREGGLATSGFASGVQWDMPFGWAPTNWLAVSGLDRYGYREDAVRVARAFSKSVLENYRRDGTIREKYNVVEASANVKVAAGYKSNVIGFGWTNAVYLKMQDLIAAPAATNAK